MCNIFKLVPANIKFIIAFYVLYLIAALYNINFNL